MMHTNHRQYAEQAGLAFLASLQALPVFKPAPGIDLGQLRITATLLTDGGLDLGYVDLDPINLRGVADATVVRGDDLRAKHARLTGRPALRLIGGGER
ncbi:hypothetical protein [Streptomyces sp. NPDC058985]|uniref:hypothetical protein n=1 Tax=Streptomyces sp. NPDC058985 TaxID=3346684 RepID=UPI0036C69187